ncbi:ryanodine receptor 1-like [Chelonoidis abingdonii]|uniref:ryanodine receptor 1-like n=1 Tax=Chelonoidis abingdonii TaxID=106734 RepID=UPI003F491498
MAAAPSTSTSGNKRGVDLDKWSSQGGGHRTLLYGHAILLRHSHSAMYLSCLTTSRSLTDKLAFDVGLQEDASGEACWWIIHPASKQRSEGEKVRVGDDLILVSVSSERYLHLSTASGDLQADASFMQTLWNMNPICSGCEEGYVTGGHVMRLFHGHMDECLTISSSEQGEEERRVVNYEGGGVCTHARSLWRLEPLRISWSGSYMRWGQQFRVRHVTTGRYLGLTEEKGLVVLDAEKANTKATAFCFRASKVRLDVAPSGMWRAWGAGDQGMITLVLDCIDRLNLYSTAAHFAEFAGEEAAESWKEIVNLLYELLASLIRGNRSNCALFSNNLDWLVSKLDRLEASSGILEVLYCVLIESPEVLNIIQENHIKSIISLLDKHGRNHKVLDVLCSLCVCNGVAVRSNQNLITENLLPRRDLLLQTSLINYVTSMRPNIFLGTHEGSTQYKKWYYELIVDYVEPFVTAQATHLRVGWAITEGYSPYPGGGEGWGGNGVGDDLYSFGFDGLHLWSGIFPQGQSSIPQCRSSSQANTPNSALTEHGYAVPRRALARPAHAAADDVCERCLTLSVPSMSFRHQRLPRAGMFENFNVDGLFFPVSASPRASMSYAPCFEALLPEAGYAGGAHQGYRQDAGTRPQLLAHPALFHTAHPLPRTPACGDQVAHGASELVRVSGGGSCLPPCGREGYFDVQAVTTGEMRVAGPGPDVRPDTWTGGRRSSLVFNGTGVSQRWQSAARPFAAPAAGDVSLHDRRDRDHIFHTLTGDADQRLGTLLALGCHVGMADEKAEENLKKTKLPKTYMMSNGYKPAPLDLAHVNLTPAQNTLVDKLAENGHNVWARDRVSQGWTYSIVQDIEQANPRAWFPYHLAG